MSIELKDFGVIADDSKLIETERTSNGAFTSGKDGVRHILKTPDSKVELIGFADKTIAYVPSATHYEAYYPVHPVSMEKPLKAVLMDLDGTSVKSEEFWIWIIESSLLLPLPLLLLSGHLISLPDNQLFYHHLFHMIFCLGCPQVTSMLQNSFQRRLIPNPFTDVICQLSESSSEHRLFKGHLLLKMDLTVLMKDLLL